MIEKQLEERMHAVLVDEPPLGFDPDEVVDLAIRRQLRRRSTVAVAAVATTVSVAAVAFGGFGADQGRQVATSPTSSVEPPAWESGAVSDDSPAACPTQLSAVLPGLLAKHVPGIEFTAPEVSNPNEQLQTVVGTAQDIYVFCAADFGIDDDPFGLAYGAQQLSDGPVGGNARVRTYQVDDGDRTIIAAIWTRGDEVLARAVFMGTGELLVRMDQLVALVSDQELTS